MPMPTRAITHRALSIAALAAGIALAGSVMPGCSSTETFGPKPTSRNASNNAEARLEARAAEATVDHDGWRTLGYRLDWRGFPPVTTGQTIQHLRPYDDVILVQEGGSILSVLETDTGRLRWSNELATRLTRFVAPIRSDDRVLASSESELHVLSIDTGTLVDRQSYSIVINTKPIEFGDLLVYGTAAGELMGHLTTFGVEAWANAADGSINVTPVRIGSAVGAVTQSGDVFFVDGPTGSLIGKTRIFDGLVTPPAASDNLLFAASLDQSVYAITPAGQTVWRYRTGYPLRYRPVYHAGTVYVAVPDEGLVALGAQSGDVQWRTPDIRGHVVAERGDALVVWDAENEIAHTVRTSDGTLIASVELPGTLDLVAHGFVDGTMFAVARNGVLAKFIARN